ncbi:hypothetical protein JQS43_16295 [Natronosporangium hydrolyticum]|uniref:Uncharacterized protein n=1 Tax=Natronosporangium hydrolyticum TaxID=2811111 RepID=A0A895YCV9_9ACTN|nr:DUF6229 family protein [Natronosporangium hydrolyticum]QSB13189.1 hypothetical protein JQS43_16295 [Natronosporangium hydrolyticum]
MPTLTIEQVDEIIDGWRNGEEQDGLENPAGPLFSSSGYAESEITLTGTGYPGLSCGTGCSGSYDPATGMHYFCC